MERKETWFKVESEGWQECAGNSCVERFHRICIPKTVPHPMQILPIPTNNTEREYFLSLMELYQEAIASVTRLKAGIAEAVARHDIDRERIVVGKSTSIDLTMEWRER